MARSAIEWTDATWNPVTGCSKVSEGCRHCYAERMAARLQAMGQAKYRDGFEVALHPEHLEDPFKWKKPRMVFVNSMSDLFHEKIPVGFIDSVFETMVRCPQHTFQVLTKRPGRAVTLGLPWARNIWFGVSVESSKQMERVRCLVDNSAASVSFVSAEPLLGPLPCLGRYMHDLDWIIAGGESGPGARPMHPDWAREVRDLCVQARVPFFFKQWGGTNKKKAGRVLDGRTWDQMPAVRRRGAPAHPLALPAVIPPGRR